LPPELLEDAVVVEGRQKNITRVVGGKLVFENEIPWQVRWPPPPAPAGRSPC
jgi:hypothetical protein